MSRSLRSIVSRILALVLLANLLGMSAGAYAGVADIHADEVQAAVAANDNQGSGGNSESSDCGHGCHMSHHFTGQVGGTSTYTPPLTGACPATVPCIGPAFIGEFPFRPPLTPALA